MDLNTPSKMLNALGVLKSDPEHMKHILNCDSCRVVYGNLDDLVTAYINVRNENGALKAKVKRLETESKTH